MSIGVDDNKPIVEQVRSWFGVPPPHGIGGKLAIALADDYDRQRALLQRFMACRFPEGSGWKVASGANAGDSLSKVYLDAKKHFAGKP